MKIILLGAPGAGKGTQATRISEKFNIPHISTGDILRDNIRRGTELGKLAKSIIEEGRLVPDSVMIDIVKVRLSESDTINGWLLDGFPRTIAQAEALDKVTSVDAVININIPLEKLLVRLTGRRMCQCGESYHISTYKSDICSKCGKPLYIRDDDNEVTVHERLKAYEQMTAPLADYYKSSKVLVDINGNQGIDMVFADICKQVEEQ